MLGITNEGTRRRLLSEKKLTLLTAIEMCRTAEQTAIRMRAMDVASMPSAETVHAVARKPFKSNQRKQSNSPRLVDTSRTCRYCGNVHSRGRDCCPAYGKTCRLCGTNITLQKCVLKVKANLQKENCTALKIPRRVKLGTVMMIFTQSSPLAQCIWKGRNGLFPCDGWQDTALSVRFRSNMQCDELQGQSKGGTTHPLRHSNVKRLYSGESLNSMGVFDTDCGSKGENTSYHLR